MRLRVQTRRFPTPLLTAAALAQYHLWEFLVVTHDLFTPRVLFFVIYFTFFFSLYFFLVFKFYFSMSFNDQVSFTLILMYFIQKHFYDKTREEIK